VSRSSLPARPFRDSAIMYAVLACVVVVIAWATGAAVLPRIEDDGNVVVGALPIALGFFLLGTGYAWWRFRKRLESERQNS